MKPTRAEIGSMIISLIFIIAAALVLLGGESKKDSGSFEIKTAAALPPSPSLSENALDESSGNGTACEKIDINTGTNEDFQSLYGIGEALSLAIIEYREENGPFSQIEDIMLVPGIGKAKFDDICQYISVK